MHPVDFSSIAELPFLNDNFQTNFNPRNLGISNKWNTGCLQVFKRSLSHSQIMSFAFLASCKWINHKSKSIKIHWRAVRRQKIALNSPHCFAAKCTSLCEMYTQLVYRRHQTCLTRIHLFALFESGKLQNRKTFTNSTQFINLEPKRTARVKIS